MKNTLDAIFAAVTEDQSFVLTNETRSGWIAAIGNTSDCVAISEGLLYGDDAARFVGRGGTAQEALDNLLRSVLS